MKLFGPLNCGSVSIRGIEMKVKNGILEVEANIAKELEAFGFKPHTMQPRPITGAMDEAAPAATEEAAPAAPAAEETKTE